MKHKTYIFLVILIVAAAMLSASLTTATGCHRVILPLVMRAQGYAIPTVPFEINFTGGGIDS